MPSSRICYNLTYKDVYHIMFIKIITITKVSKSFLEKSSSGNLFFSCVTQPFVLAPWPNRIPLGPFYCLSSFRRAGDNTPWKGKVYSRRCSWILIGQFHPHTLQQQTSPWSSPQSFPIGLPRKLLMKWSMYRNHNNSQFTIEMQQILFHFSFLAMNSLP